MQDFVHRQYDRVRKSWEMNQRSYDIILTVPSKVMISANGWWYQLSSQQAWSGGHCISRNSQVGNYPTWQRQGVKSLKVLPFLCICIPKSPNPNDLSQVQWSSFPKSCWNHIETISPRPETMLGVSWEGPTWTTLCPSQGREIQHHIDTIDLPVSLVHPGRSPRVVAEALPKFPSGNAPRCWVPDPNKNACSKMSEKDVFQAYASRNLPRNHTIFEKGDHDHLFKPYQNCSPHQPWRNLKHHFSKRRKHHEVYSIFIYIYSSSISFHQISRPLAENTRKKTFICIWNTQNLLVRSREWGNNSQSNSESQLHQCPIICGVHYFGVTPIRIEITVFTAFLVLVSFKPAALRLRKTQV